MNTTWQSGLRLTGILIPLMVLGCGQRELPKENLYPVSGKVEMNGAPVPFVMLTLTPTTKGKGTEATAKTGADGSFTLRTYSNEEPDGAARGEYKLTLEEWDPVKAGGLPRGATAPKLTPAMKDPGVTVEISGETDDLKITIPASAGGK